MENKLSFENASFKVEATKQPGCKLAVAVTVSTEQAKKTYKEAIKKVNKQISIPGFRKGKAPDASVISRYSSYIEQEWKDILVQSTVEGAFDLIRIYPVNRELLDRPKIISCDHESGAEIAFSYEFYPDVPTINFSDLSLPAIEKTAPSEERVNEVVEEIKKAHPNWEEIKDRAVEKGDYVDISVDAIEPPASIVKNRRVPADEAHLAPWLAKLLIGLKVGEEIEGESEGERPTKVRVTLHAIQKILLPELDDELAKKVGASSKEDLMEKIHHNLDQVAEEDRKQKYVSAVEEALLKTYHFDLPASLIKSEREIRIDEKLKESQQQSLSSESEAEIDQLVDRSLRLYFLNRQVAKQGKLSLTQQELNDELAVQMQQNPLLFKKTMDKETSQKLISRLSADLMDRKTKDYLLSQLLTN